MYVIVTLASDDDAPASNTILCGIHYVRSTNSHGNNVQWFQQSHGRARLQRIGTSNTKLLDAELLFLGRLVDDPRLRLVLPEVAVAVVLEEVGQQAVQVTVIAEEIVIQVGVQLSTFASDYDRAPLTQSVTVSIYTARQSSHKSIIIACHIVYGRPYCNDACRHNHARSHPLPVGRFSRNFR